MTERELFDCLGKNVKMAFADEIEKIELTDN